MAIGKRETCQIVPRMCVLFMLVLDDECTIVKNY